MCLSFFCLSYLWILTLLVIESTNCQLWVENIWCSTSIVHAWNWHNFCVHRCYVHECSPENSKTSLHSFRLPFLRVRSMKYQTICLSKSMKLHHASQLWFQIVILFQNTFSIFVWHRNLVELNLGKFGACYGNIVTSTHPWTIKKYFLDLLKFLAVNFIFPPLCSIRSFFV